MRAYCSFKETDAKIKDGVEFQREAVRIALISVLPRKRVVVDLGIGLSTLTRWVSLHYREELPASAVLQVSERD